MNPDRNSSSDNLVPYTWKERVVGNAALCLFVGIIVSEEIWDTIRTTYSAARIRLRGGTPKYSPSSDQDGSPVTRVTSK